MEFFHGGEIWDTDESELIAETEPRNYGDIYGFLGCEKQWFYRTKNNKFFIIKQEYVAKGLGIWLSPKTPTDIPKGKKRFWNSVSWESMIYRLKNCGLQDAANKLIKEFAKKA